MIENGNKYKPKGKVEKMTSLERMMAAINGEPFDMYPFVNPHPWWSMMPHWPEMLGLTWLHVHYGTDEERIRCRGAFHEVLGLDWIPLPWGAAGQDERYRIETEDGVPVLVDIIENTRQRHEEFPKDEPMKDPIYPSLKEVESWPPPATAEELLAGNAFSMVKKFVQRYGDTVFLVDACLAPFPFCYRVLGFDKLYDALINDPGLLHAIMEQQTEAVIQRVKAMAQMGVHGMHMGEYWCSAELISEKHYLEFAFPYEQKIIRAVRDEGLVAIMEFLGWAEPRLPHIAKLGLNCWMTESSLKGYRNDVGEYRKVLGEEVCIFGNSRILQVIEQGDEEVWRQDALEQVRGVGKQRRYAICAGGATTWATTPDRLRRYGEFTRKVLAEVIPPLG